MKVSVTSLIGLATFWLCVLPSCQADFDVNCSSYINVEVPTSLHVNSTADGMKHHSAHFGRHWDGARDLGHMVHPVRYAAGNLCKDPSANVTKSFGQPPFFLLADMGGCTPVSKARRAQELGAAGLVLAHHRCLCNETDCTNEGECVSVLPPLMDDGSGHDVGIPAMVIEKGRGEKIKAALRDKHPVVMEMAWHTPRMEHTVSVDFFYSPSSTSTMDFLNDFAKIALALEDQVEFRPHYHILNGKKMDCVNHADHPGDACYQLCTNSGRYCSVSHATISGHDIVQESLRRMCVLHHFPGKPFWLYLEHFAKDCQKPDYFSRPGCLTDVYGHSKVKESDIDQCMSDSGGIAQDEVNRFLQTEMEESAGLLQTPTIWINKLPLRKSMTTKNVVEAICAGYQSDKAPKFCRVCGSCGDPALCASRHPMKCHSGDGEQPSPHKTQKKRGGGFFKVVFYLLLLCALCYGGFVYYKRYMEDGDGMHSFTLRDALMSDQA